MVQCPGTGPLPPRLGDLVGLESQAPCRCALTPTLVDPLLRPKTGFEKNGSVLDIVGSPPGIIRLALCGEPGCFVRPGSRWFVGI